MPESVETPQVLDGDAADIWRAAFLSSYDGTCKERGDERDACAASVAWSAVKQKYEKDHNQWVAKSEGELARINRIQSAFSKYMDDMRLAAAAQAAIGVAPGTPSGYLTEIFADGTGVASVDGRFYRVPFSETTFGGVVFAPRLDWQEVVQDWSRKSMTVAKAEVAMSEISPKTGLIIPILTARQDEKPYDEMTDEEKEEARKKKLAEEGGEEKSVLREGPPWEKKEEEMTDEEKEEARKKKLAEEAGEEKSVIELPGYETRAHQRRAANDVDWGVIRSGVGGQEAIRPDHISSERWNRLSAPLKTVGAVLFERICQRTYEQSVEDCIVAGWTPISNPSRPEEFVFRRWLAHPQGRLLQRTVLVRHQGVPDWYLRELSRGASLSLAMATAPGEVRYRGPKLLLRGLPEASA
jgi:cation transport regulator ChaB